MQTDQAQKSKRKNTKRIPGKESSAEADTSLNNLRLNSAKGICQEQVVWLWEPYNLI